MCLSCQLTDALHDVESARHPMSSEWLWTELALMREQASLSAHPYVGAMCRGELRAEDLCVLATEHDHIVTAVVAAACRAAALTEGLLHEGLTALADDAAHERQLWRRFSAAVGWTPADSWYYGEDPYPETISCALLLAGREGEGVGELVARLSTVQKLQADVADAQALALGAHYGLQPAARQWFARRGGERGHAAAIEGAINRATREDGPFGVLQAARNTADGFGRFYDSLELARRSGGVEHLMTVTKEPRCPIAPPRGRAPRRGGRGPRRRSAGW